jgi:hypothetical protein
MTWPGSGRPGAPCPGRVAALSASASLMLPRCLERILDGTSVASGEISDDHHVLDVPGRHTEGLGELPQDRGAVVEIGANHQMRAVKLAGDEPAVVPPLGQPVRRSAAYTFQRPGQPVYLAYLQHCRLPCLSVPTTTR